MPETHDLAAGCVQRPRCRRTRSTCAAASRAIRRAHARTLSPEAKSPSRSSSPSSAHTRGTHTTRKASRGGRSGPSGTSSGHARHPSGHAECPPGLMRLLGNCEEIGWRGTTSGEDLRPAMFSSIKISRDSDRKEDVGAAAPGPTSVYVAVSTPAGWRRPGGEAAAAGARSTARRLTPPLRREQGRCFTCAVPRCRLSPSRA